MKQSLVAGRCHRRSCSTKASIWVDMQTHCPHFGIDRERAKPNAYSTEKISDQHITNYLPYAERIRSKEILTKLLTSERIRHEYRIETKSIAGI